MKEENVNDHLTLFFRCVFSTSFSMCALVISFFSSFNDGFGDYDDDDDDDAHISI